MKQFHIGFIGLGIMGTPMAKNLIKKGYKLTVYDRNESKRAGFQAMGAKVVDSCREAARNADIVITMLQNSPHVREAVLGETGAIHGMNKGDILIDMSSIAPLESQAIAAELAKKGVEMIDAPVSGGQPKAEEGTLAVMCGGKQEIFDKVKDILLCMGSTATRVGGIGSGNTTKLANQMIVGLNIAAMSEAMVLAQKAGVDPGAVFEAIKGGLAGSTVLNAKMPLLLARNYKPGFRIELHIKDLANALATAHAVGSPAPLTAQVLEMMHALKVDGKGGEDHGGLVQYFEKLAHVTIGNEAVT